MGTFNVPVAKQTSNHAAEALLMGKQGDTGAYWANKEYELVSYALNMREILQEFIDCSPDDAEDLWFLYDTKAAIGKIIDAYEPEGEPEEGYKDNVISFARSKALKR